MLTNIIDNAIKYTPTGGVNVKIVNQGNVRIIISDTGIGIPQDKIKNILSPKETGQIYKNLNIK